MIIKVSLESLLMFLCQKW